LALSVARKLCINANTRKYNTKAVISSIAGFEILSYIWIPLLSSRYNG